MEPESTMAARAVSVLLAGRDLPRVLGVEALLAGLADPPHDCTRARELEAAVQLAAEGSFDVVLLDLELASGAEVQAVQQLLAGARGVPLVVLCGPDDEQLGHAGVAAGAQDYLVEGQLDAALIARLVRHARSRQQLQSELALKNLVLDQLGQLDRMKSQFIEVVVHEMKTPMTAVLCAVDLLMDGSLGQVGQSQLQYLQMVARNINRLARFTTEVLSLSRIDSDNYLIKPVELTLDEALETTAARLVAAAEADEQPLALRIEGTGEGSGVRVFADPEVLAEVVSHLVRHTAARCGEGTEVTLGWHPLADGLVQVTVSDRGPEIPADQLDNLFNRVRQVKDKSGPGYKGSGIGLSISKGLVEKMGGHMDVHSSAAAGTTFSFTLPCAGSDDFLFGKLAVKMGYVSMEQLQHVVGVQQVEGDHHQRLGEILMEKKLISRARLEHVLSWQKVLLARPHPRLPAKLGDSLLGRLAVRHGYLTEEQLFGCVRIQELRRSDGSRARLGQILVEQGYMNPQHIVDLLGEQQQLIAGCPSCEARYNTSPAEGDHGHATCPRCGTTLDVLQRPTNIEVNGDAG